MNRDFIRADQLPNIPATAVSQELQSPILLSEEDVKLVAGGAPSSIGGHFAQARLGQNIGSVAGQLGHLLPF